MLNRSFANNVCISSALNKPLTQTVPASKFESPFKHREVGVHGPDVAFVNQIKYSRSEPLRPVPQVLLFPSEFQQPPGKLVRVKHAHDMHFSIFHFRYCSWKTSYLPSRSHICQHWMRYMKNRELCSLSSLPFSNSPISLLNYRLFPCLKRPKSRCSYRR